MFLYGKNSVFERIKNKPESIRRIMLEENFDDLKILEAIKSSKLPFDRVAENKLLRIKRADRLQGIIAEVDEFKYVDFGDLLSEAKGNNKTLIFLDSLNDPHNLGTIMRTLACFGGFAIIIPKHESCEINETVLHVASGGENFIPVSLVTNLSTALIEAKKEGFWAVGAVVEGGSDIYKTDLVFPMCLVLGSEGKGIRPGLEKQLELKLKIPMAGASLSFNVAMAATIFAYEINRQRKR
ncbi:MAG: 23S rRNA (guanosine(2251)-2'-O)-methyltransferase RlmB [Candidatus Omnitrophica bacterium]|nr:23S rRNA (guanosine(2251)-2'-O)-methyltransferase RlmB [Candidatus Omnitrophota bacterium]HOX54665.1 23S rRNA (guanosine(2251)-2'-O)-methyltransferase RlmB [Candidatus Omnitrophota bacterium]